ncbi:MAG: hypothetical protein ACQETM_06825, partial [Bacteroidota bacterium]
NRSASKTSILPEDLYPAITPKQKGSDQVRCPFSLSRPLPITLRDRPLSDRPVFHASASISMLWNTI